VIVDRHGQGFLRVLLPDAKAIQLPFDFARFGSFEIRAGLGGWREQLLIEDVFAKNDAVVTDVNARPGNELSDF
jgi:hypothetical protein